MDKDSTVEANEFQLAMQAERLRLISEIEALVRKLAEIAPTVAVTLTGLGLRD